MTASPRGLVLGALALALALIAGCGTSTDGGTSGQSPSPTNTSSGSSTGSHTRTSTPTPTTPTTSPGDITVRGIVSGDGLTCVRFRTTNGTTYALAGPGLPGKLVSIAHSFGRRTSLSAPPAAPQTATVTLIGHPVTGAMSTCNATVFVVTAAHIHTVTTK